MATDKRNLAEVYFARTYAWVRAEGELDRAILRAIGVADTDKDDWPCDDLWYDEYDGSFELGAVEPGFTLTPEMGAEIEKVGFRHGWLNFKDGTAKHYQGPGWGGTSGSSHSASRHSKREIARLRSQLVAARRTIGFFASVIKGGEPWTETCEKALAEAMGQSG